MLFQRTCMSVSVASAYFFNPLRYMHLVELIPCAKTSAATLDGLEAFLTTTLGKGVDL